MLIRKGVEAWRAGVVHATLNPQGQGAARLHLIPPKPSIRQAPHLLFINGWHIVPIGPSWAALLRTFIGELSARAQEGREVSDSELQAILDSVTRQMRQLYPRIPSERFIADLDEIVAIAIAIARGEELPSEMRATMTLAEYAKHMTAPHRMDLIVAPMISNGQWACPLHCKNCYAVQPSMTRKDIRELTTHEWMCVIDLCREIGVPQLTFTGGEPTTRLDIVELIDHAKWHVTRLNTSGVTMTPELARRLYEASLDSVQITLYSSDPAVHNDLVGTPGAWDLTVAGIRNAVTAGLCVSVNTPLVNANADYAATIRFIRSLGVTFASCSGLIPAGAAPTHIKRGEALDNGELFDVLRRATETVTELGMELSFTSPGWLAAEQLGNLGLATPVCGACLSNMAIAPDGEVVPCQSWLNGDSLGNILNTPWKRIWAHPLCRKVRRSAALKFDCPLKEGLR